MTYRRSIPTHTAALFAALVALTACPGEDDTSGDNSTTEAPDTTAGDEADTTEPTETAGTAGDPGQACTGLASGEPCCCFEDTEEGVALTCEVPTLCPEFTISCGTEADYQQMEPCDSSSDDAALDCALAAFATGATGTFTVHYENTHFPGFWGDDATFYLAGDGTVYVLPGEFFDLGGSIGPLERYTLKPAADFDACRAASDVEARVACLKQPWVGEATAECIERQPSF